MSKSFRDLLQGDLKVTNLNENFTDILGKEKESALHNDSSLNSISRHIKSGDLAKIAEAASHPKADKAHLEKALETGHLDHIVAMHPNAPLSVLRHILRHSTDSFARSVAAHNPNLTPRALEIAYDRETNPGVKAIMLRSEHMPKHVLEREGKEEVSKEYPSYHALESIARNHNTPSAVRESIYDKLKSGNREVGVNRKDEALKKLMHVINENGLHHKTSFGGVDIRLSKNEEDGRHGITIHAAHDYDENTKPISAYNSQRKNWAGVHERMDSIASDPYVQHHFDVSVNKINMGKANSETSRLEKEGSTGPRSHGSVMHIELKPEGE